MKSFFRHIPLFAAALAALGLASCQNSFDPYEPEAPVATLKPNMTIMELKQMYWNDATNYIDTIGIDNGVDDGKDYIIHGRVISSDEAGNMFKSLVIQDETAALALSINSYNLYLKYRMGQDVVINLKGMYIGKYNGLVQLGMPEWYAAGNAWEATFMAPEFFDMHVELNGFPDAASIDTLQINSFDELPSNPEGLCRWQSQIVKFNNVYFQNGGTQQFAEYHSSGVNQNIVDVNGNTLPVRTSGYSNFWNKYLPEGNGDLVAILSYYGTTGWQLILNDYEGCMNWGNPTVAPGTEDNPCTVAEVVESIKSGKPSSGWVTGYIVGAVAPEVTDITSNDQIEWTADVVLDNTLVIGATPDTKDISQALVISLPQGSPLRQYGNLVDNPGNYGKAITVRGLFGMYMGTYGVLDNNGKVGQWHIDGVTVSDGSAPAGNGSETSPYNVSQVIAKKPTGNADAPDESNVWVTGYIVGWADMSSVYYINAETARFSVPATLNTNVLLAATPDETDWNNCIGIQLPSGAVRTALNLVDNPGNLGREVKICGNIAKYSGVPGLRSASKYVWLSGESNPDTPTTPPAEGTGEGTSTSPYDVARALAVINAGSYTDDQVYIKGKISKIDGVDTGQYGNATYYISDDGSTANQLQVFRGYYFDGAKFTDASQIKVGDEVVIKGKLTLYNGTPEVTTGSSIVSLNGQTSAGETPGTPDQPDQPDQPVTGSSADFNTLNGGKANTSVYGTYSTTQGWTAEWALVLAGGTDATNFISESSTFLFPCIDGTPARPGKLTSPVISGGIKSLTFKYGFPYNESKVQFTVNIKQGGTVVATKTVLADPATKGVVNAFSLSCNISGDFVIEIVNDCITQSTSNNKDRVAIWDLSWSAK